MAKKYVIRTVKGKSAPYLSDSDRNPNWFPSANRARRFNSKDEAEAGAAKFKEQHPSGKGVNKIYVSEIDD